MPFFPITYGTFVELESVYVDDPGDRNRQLTLIFLHGRTCIATEQLIQLREMGFFSGLDERIRIVAPQVKLTERNLSREWFPFIHPPWGDAFGELTSRPELDETTSLLLPLIQSEAALYSNSFNRIYIFGVSHGAMMAEWLALMTNLPFGGVVSYMGLFPLFSVDAVSDAGKQVELVHFHDTRDITVRWPFVVAGYDAAVRAGAAKYRPIVEVAMQAGTHHALEPEPVGLVHQWVLSKLPQQLPIEASRAVS